MEAKAGLGVGIRGGGHVRLPRGVWTRDVDGLGAGGELWGKAEGPRRRAGPSVLPLCSVRVQAGLG